MSGGDNGPTTRHLVVRAGGVRYGLPADCVRRVIAATEIWPVPGAESHLLGLIQYGGEPLAVLDLETLARGGTPGTTGRGVVVVLALGHEASVGLAVEEAEQVMTLAAGEGSREVQLLDADWLFGTGC